MFGVIIFPLSDGRQGEFLFEGEIEETLNNFMTKEIKETEEEIDLREKAEAQYKDNAPYNSANLFVTDIQTHIRELEVQNIELEIQNEEWQKAEENSRESSDKFTALYDFAPAGYFTLDSEGTICGLNLLGAAMLGKGRAAMVNNNFTLYVTEDTREVFTEFLKKCFETNTKQVFEGNLKISEDITIWVHLEGIVPKEEKKCLLVAIDKTKRKQTELQIEKQTKELKELNATKDKFFNIIAHDLRSPFSAIIGFSNLLAEQVHDKDYEGIERYAEYIQTSSKHAMALLTNLFEWARTQTGAMEFNPEYFELVELINEITELSNDIAQQKSIAIEKVLPLKVPVTADKAMISTVLRNLIMNAIKFTNSGGKIVVSLEEKKNELLVTISDNGAGIIKEDIENLFRIDAKTTTLGTNKEKGTGLGLLLCKEFVEKHSGKIWVESEVGKGSRFNFSIPKS